MEVGPQPQVEQLTLAARELWLPPAARPITDRLVVNIVHPGNPFSPDPDGIVSVQRNFMRSAPERLFARYWGVDRPNARPVPEATWEFCPVMETTTQRPRVPLTVRFALAMARCRSALDEGIIRFDRFESALPLLSSPAPKVLFLHTSVSQDIRNEEAESRWRRLPTVHDSLLRRVARRMDRIYGLMPAIVEDLRERVPEVADRIGPFSIPVDLSRFGPLPPASRERARDALASSLNVTKGGRFVLFAGRLEGQKRPLILPDIASELSRRSGGELQREVHLLVAGTGTLEDELRRKIRRHAPCSVHLLGPLPQESLARLLASVHALILPSAFEGLPNIVLEALASGTPVVATRSAGRAKEVLELNRTGLVVSDDPEILAAALGEVLAWNDTAAARCRATAERFSPSALNEPIYRDLQEMAAGRIAASTQDHAPV